MCMSMRGVEKQGALTSSTCFLGDFATDPQRRLEFLVSVRGPSAASVAGSMGSGGPLVGLTSAFGGLSIGGASDVTGKPCCARCATHAPASASAAAEAAPR